MKNVAFGIHYSVMCNLVMHDSYSTVTPQQYQLTNEEQAFITMFCKLWIDLKSNPSYRPCEQLDFIFDNDDEEIGCVCDITIKDQDRFLILTHYDHFANGECHRYVIVRASSWEAIDTLSFVLNLVL